MKFKILEDVKKGEVIVLDIRRRTAKLLRATEDFTSLVPHVKACDSPEDYRKNGIADIEIITKLDEETKVKLNNLKKNMQS